VGGWGHGCEGGGGRVWVCVSVPVLECYILPGLDFHTHTHMFTHTHLMSHRSAPLHLLPWKMSSVGYPYA
jgi:hypothetical protein